MTSAPEPKKAYKNLDFLNSEDARTIRILAEYLEPEVRLESEKIKSSVLFFGSARVHPDDTSHPLSGYYRETEQLAYLLAEWAIDLKVKGKNFVICTGGGPGLMEAANRGATRAGGVSIGMNISLPFEQAPNRFISPDLSFLFHYFFMRKFWLVYKARAIVALPGGFGTLDEIFELLTLAQTGKIDRNNIVILFYGEEYWRRIINFEALVEARTISPEDLELFQFSSSPEDAFTILKARLVEFL